MKKQKTKKIEKQDINWREVYIENRNFEILQFESNLIEIQKEKPSVSGTINGRSFQDFAYSCIFLFLKDQEDATRSEAEYVDKNEELIIFNKCRDKAKSIIGPDFDLIFEDYKNPNK